MIKPKNFFIIIEFQTFIFSFRIYSYCVTRHGSIAQHSHAHFNISSRTHKIFIANKSLQCMIFCLLSILFVFSAAHYFCFIFCGCDYVVKKFIPSIATRAHVENTIELFKKGGGRWTWKFKWNACRNGEELQGLDVLHLKFKKTFIFVGVKWAKRTWEICYKSSPLVIIQNFHKSQKTLIKSFNLF